MPILPTTIEMEKSKRATYESLLVVDGNILPDPLSIFEKWEGEKQGLTHWPGVFITDITAFLMKTEKEEIALEHLNQYKIGKAYEYYASEWMKEVYYHPIAPNSAFCYLRARCTPSQSLNAATHSVWVCCEKATGKIKRAYCSCTSGYVYNDLLKLLDIIRK